MPGENEQTDTAAAMGTGGVPGVSADSSGQFVPQCLTTDDLRDALCCSEIQRRKLIPLLRRSKPDLWSSRLSEEDFYKSLLSFLSSPGARTVYRDAARRVEKKKKPLELDVAFYRAVYRQHRTDQTFLELEERIDPREISGIAEVVSWLAENDLTESAVNLVWAFLDVHPGLPEYIRRNVEQEALRDAVSSFSVGTGSDSEILPGPTSQNQECLSLGEAVNRLKQFVSRLDSEDLDAGQIEKLQSILDLVSTLLEADKLAEEKA